MRELREDSLSLDQTLETLRGALDPQTFQLAKASLEAELARRKEEADRALGHQIQLDLIEGYHYAIERSKAGFAHVEGGIISAAVQYLKLKADTEITSELDGMVRLFSGYVVCKDTRDYDSTDELVAMIRRARVDPEDVFTLIRQYWERENITFGDGWPTPERLEDVIEHEMVADDLTWEYFPSSGLAERIQTELLQLLEREYQSNDVGDGEE